jgi:hypothetical protein
MQYAGEPTGNQNGRWGENKGRKQAKGSKSLHTEHFPVTILPVHNACLSIHNT